MIDSMNFPGLNQRKVDGDEVRALREALDLTQEQFATIFGTTYATVNQWENGSRKPSRLAVTALVLFMEVNGIDRKSLKPSIVEKMAARRKKSASPNTTDDAVLESDEEEGDS